MDPRKALNETMARFNIRAVDVANISDIGPNELSRYRSGRSDFVSARAFRLVRALPRHAQMYFFDLVTQPDEPESKNEELQPALANK
jgi:hypothetical protein